MEEIKFDLIEKVCEKQNFDELLLQIVKSNKENRINRILQNIEENKKFDKKLKRQIYEGIFDYVDDVNKYLKNNLKKIFSIAAKETIIQINSELNGGNVDMWRKIKVIIADDNVHFCKFIREYLEKYNDIEILGVANSDEDEIKMIEELKPEIVITDLMRNHRYTGLDIIKKYNDANSKIKFLVISADYKKDVITDELNVAGYIKKPFNDYIEFKSKTTIDETYFDLRTLLRYIKLLKTDKDKIYTITIDEFKKISIIDITLEDLNNITPNNLEKYIIFLNNILTNDIKTRNRKLASLKKFFEYLETNNFISLNPSKNMTSGRVEKRIPKHLSLIESKQLLSNVIKSNNRFKIRNYAITCVFLNCSLRLSELTSIDLSDLKLDDSEQTLKVHGKGNKERLIYLDAAVCEAIICYLQVRPNLGKDNKDHDALFISGQNKRISNRTVQTIIKDELLALLNENPYKEKYHTHTLRHTGATLLYNEKDINIFVLKRILGHECLDATEIYTHISDKKLKYIMENCTISSILERNGGQR